MEPICIVECEDCGESPILDPSCVTIFKLKDEYMAATICIYCERPLIGPIPHHLVMDLRANDVQLLDWIEDGT
jgi:hypothetical protein